MSRRILKPNWNRKQLDDTNKNFEELYNTREEALDIAEESKENSDKALSIANQANKTAGEAKDIAKDTNDRMNDIIADGGDSNPEIVDARKPFGLESSKTLNERLNLQFGDNEDFRPEEISMISKMKNEFTDRGINPSWFKAKFDGETDDHQSIQKTFDEAKSKRGTKVIFPKNKEFVIKETIDISPFTEIDFNGCTLKPDLPIGSEFKVFTTSNSGDVVLKNLRSLDTEEKKHTFFSSTGTVNDDGDVTNNYNKISYVRKFMFDNIYLHNYNLCVDARFCRQLIITNSRFEGVVNGVLIKDKSVEMNISKSLIYGQMEPGSYGIKTENTYDNKWHYPEGLMIDDCTIDNFDKSIEFNAGFAFKVTNSYIATNPDTGTASIYFGNKGISSHNEQVIISNNVIGGKGIVFKPEVAPPTKFKTIISNVVFSDIKGFAIYLGNHAHDVSISSVRCYGNPDNNEVAIVGTGDNQNIDISDVFADEFFIGCVVLNGEHSTGNKVSNLLYKGSGPYLYSQTPLLSSDIPYRAGYQDDLYRMINIAENTYAKNDVLARLNELNYAKGSRLRLRIQMPVSPVNGQSTLKISANVNFSIVSGPGWSSEYITVDSKQYITYELLLRCKEEIINQNIELIVENGSNIYVGYHGNMSIEVV